MGEPVTIRMLGTSFTIQTDQDPAYVASLVEYVKEKAVSLERAGYGESTMTAILTSLLIADELHQLKTTGTESDAGEASDVALRLIRQIDAVLDDD